VNRSSNVAHVRPPVVSAVPRVGTQPPLRAERRLTARPQWTTGWRNDQRYNWSEWRRHHRSNFHLQSYRDPFGWGYQLFSIGWRLWPAYYNSSDYWINDPWMYRLPPAPPGTRWIRYYNDALLVDMWTGEVVDVIHGFFW
jgi:Ni/Co efflux regulator RcnB